MVHDERGFYTSRALRAYIAEAASLIEEGVDPALIEQAAHYIGMPIGPLALVDDVSLELLAKFARQDKDDLGEAYSEKAGDQAFGPVAVGTGDCVSPPRRRSVLDGRSVAHEGALETRSVVKKFDEVTLFFQVELSLVALRRFPENVVPAGGAEAASSLPALPHGPSGKPRASRPDERSRRTGLLARRR